MGRRSVTNPAASSAAAVACALAVAAAVVVISSCASAALVSAPTSSVLFFSDAPALFRQRQNEEAAAVSAVSAHALAHVVDALVGRPIPAGETAAAQQVDALLSPNVFSRARWLLTVVVSGVPSSSSDAAGAALSSKTFKLTDGVSLSLVQQRAVATTGAEADDDADDDSTAEAAEALLRELSAVASAGRCSVSQQSKEALQRCLSSEAGDAEACAGVAAQLEEGVECVEGSTSTTAYPRPGQPASVSLLHVPLQQADPAAVSSERLQSAVEAVVARAASLAQAAASGTTDLPSDARMVVAVVLVPGAVDEARLRQAVEADGSRTRGGAHARALMAEEEGEGEGEAKVASDAGAAAAASTPEDVALNTVLFGAVFFLLAAFALGVVALFTMPITRDTLLYSGAKMD